MDLPHLTNVSTERRLECAANRRKLILALIREGSPQPVQREFALRFIFADVDIEQWMRMNNIRMEYDPFLREVFYDFHFKTEKDYLTDNLE